MRGIEILRGIEIKKTAIAIVNDPSSLQSVSEKPEKKDHHQSKYSLPLPHGSLLIMKGDLQENWEHRIAKSTVFMKPRINLTFRLIGAS